MVIIKSIAHRTFLLLSIALASGCATQAGGNWGAATTFTPGWDRVGEAARKAVTDPLTWVPTAGAAVFAITDLDDEVLEWATDHNPIFGNIEDAKDWSDDLAVVASVNWFATAALAPSGDEHLWPNKARGMGMQALTLFATRSVTDGLKSLVDRERPDRPADNSFPSLHTSGATSAATLAARNIDYMNISDTQKAWWKAGGYTVAGLTGWARIEGNRHYPSDVLFGFALGHFIAAFMNDAFVTPEGRDNVAFRVNTAGPDGLVVGLDYQF
jgi:membrane-associated phospholipid phosphatase